jgi:hypothetical protein
MMRCQIARAAIAIGGLALPAAAAAQVSGMVDASLGSGGTDQAAAAAVLSVAPAFSWLTPVIRVAGSGVYSDHGETGWGMQGWATVSALTPALRGFRLEGLGNISASRHGTGMSTAAPSLGLRLHRSNDWGGLYFGTQYGAVVVAGSSIGVTKVEGGMWGEFGSGRVQLEAGRTSLQDGVIRLGSMTSLQVRDGDTASARFRVRQFTDLRATGRWTLGPLELGAGLGRRLGVLPFRAAWWHLDGTVWMTPQIALVTAVGRYPTDVAAALPGGRYATMAVRFPLLNTDRPGPLRLSTARARTAFSAQGDGAGRVRIVIMAPGAQRVEIMGSFSDWKPVEMQAAWPDYWQAAVPMQAGLHQINVRYDGGAWQVPPETTPIADEFGGVVGTFAVE